MNAAARENAAIAPDWHAILSGRAKTIPAHSAADIQRETVFVAMRDGLRLATDIYFPADARTPTLAMRTPYGRALLEGTYLRLATHGYVIVVQDVRGTGDSESDSWEFALHEATDSIDLVDWIVDQPWYDGFIGGLGGSYVAMTQWAMAMHPAMIAIAPEMGSLDTGRGGPHVRPHMFVNAYSRTVGKGDDKVDVDFREMERRIVAETLATGYFNDPLPLRAFPATLTERCPQLASLSGEQARAQLWQLYCKLGSAQRADLIKHALDEEHITVSSLGAMSSYLPSNVSGLALYLPAESAAHIHAAARAPALVITGWYDWGLDETLASWNLLMQHGQGYVRAASRLLITPSAHDQPGYHEGSAGHPELTHPFRLAHNVELLLRWYGAMRDGTANVLPPVTYYLMGANEWRTADAWPPADAEVHSLFLGENGELTEQPPSAPSEPDTYVYDPADPTPTVGGSIVSSVYPPGSVDVSAVQRRDDVLSYTTTPLERSVDVVGWLRMVLYASSSAVDTDFVARVSDVFPDGRAIQLQSGIVRARWREHGAEPSLLEPDEIYRFDILIGATANRFDSGHRIRVDLSSADFPKLERNANRGGTQGDPLRARQKIYHDAPHPSHLLLPVLPHAQPVAPDNGIDYPSPEETA